MRRLGAVIPVVYFVVAIADGPVRDMDAGRAVRASETDQNILGRTLTLRTEPRVPAYEVIFSAHDGRREARVAVAGGTAEQRLAVPHYADGFVVQVGRARSGQARLPTHGGGLTIVRVALSPSGPAGYEVVIEPQAR